MPYKNADKKRAWQNKMQQLPKWKRFISDYNLRRKYKISLDVYEELLEKQNGSCALCSRKESREGYRLAVDHNHNTGEIRGLLCYPCNRTISKDRDVKYFEGVIDYLKRPAPHIVEVDKNGKFVYN